MWGWAAAVSGGSGGWGAWESPAGAIAHNNFDRKLTCAPRRSKAAGGLDPSGPLEQRRARPPARPDFQTTSRGDRCDGTGASHGAVHSP